MINRNYSFDTLASVLATEEFTSADDIHFGIYEFKDAVVEVVGHLKGYFDIQKQTHEDPPFCDLKDVCVKIESVHISGDDYEKIFLPDEKRKLEKQIKDLMI